MKKRYYETTFEATDIQKQLNSVKHERARKMLEARLHSTYLESFVNLEKPEAVIWIPYTSYVSDKVMEVVESMVLSIMNNYPQIKKVDIYGRDAIIEAIEKGEIKQFPKSSTIQPKIEEEDSILPSIVVNNVDYIHTDKETKEQTNLLMDLKDQALLGMGKEPGIENEQGDLEAGEIRIINETIDTPKNNKVDALQ